MQKEVPLVELFWDIFNNVNEGIIATDSNGKIIFYNKELAKLEELTPETVIGKNLRTVYTDVSFDTSEHLKVIKIGKPVMDKRKRYFTSQGKEVHIVASTYPVFHKDKVIAAYSICRNITRISELVAKTMQLQDQISQETQEQLRNNGTKFRFDSIVYASSSMKNLINSAKKTAEADCSVLIFGETGTGKELFVQAIHNYSDRKGQPFVAINCAAIPETLLESILFGTVKGAFTGAVEAKGLFEQACGGTLFLDEINSMSISLQAKLLRVIQEKTLRRVGGNTEITIQCRIISSTNVDPWECISKGDLRKDLFYRLAVISLYIPPLRERPEDIEALLNHFINKYQRIYGATTVTLNSRVKDILLKYQWPGNVRELEHIIESALNMLDENMEITLEHLPPYLKNKLSNPEELYSGEMSTNNGTLAGTLRNVEREVLIKALQMNGGNITRTADTLGIARQNLQYRIKKLGIKNELL